MYTLGTALFVFFFLFLRRTLVRGHQASRHGSPSVLLQLCLLTRKTWRIRRPTLTVTMAASLLQSLVWLEFPQEATSVDSFGK